LRDVGTAVRFQLPDGVFLDLAVVVDKNWQNQSERVDRLLDPDILMEGIADLDDGE
jgi:GTPase Era involved in 16S rRNA processing